MKEFMEIMGKDIMNENFTRKDYVIYGIIAPMALIAICMLASMVE